MLLGQGIMAGAHRTISYQRATREAAQLYERCYQKGMSRRFFRRLLGMSSSLLVPECNRGGAASGTRTGTEVVGAIPIDRIRGSEVPCGAFDDRFLPVARTHDRDRWITIAANFLLGNAVPIATLVALGEELYVRSGHEAISVARAFGQTAVDVRIVHLPDDTSRHTGNVLMGREETTAPGRAAIAIRA